MMTKRHSLGWFAWAAGVAAALISAGCAAKTPPRVGEAPAVPKTPPAGIVLEYKMPAGRVLRYQDQTETQEITEVMGQTIDTQTTSTNAYSFRAKGSKGKDHLLGVTIDDMSMTITSPRGDLSPDLKSVKGKSFDMVLSSLGAEVDVSGAESITYESLAGTRSVASNFKVFFPDLPDKPVKVGESWPSSNAVEEKSGTVDLRLDFQSINTLEGIETVDGMACARIASNVTGSISGTGSQQGLDMLFGGTHKGKDIWYFALKEGIFIKSTSELTAEMTVSISGAQAMTIPVTQTRKSEVRLAGR